MMITFIKIITGIYILYYLVNILYDMFLKKEKQPQEQEGKEEFSLEHIETVNVDNVSIDDVEEIKTSSNMEIDENEIFSDDAPKSNDDEHLKNLKRKFEEEENLNKKLSPKSKENSNDKDSDSGDTDKENIGGNSTNQRPINKSEILEQNQKKIKEIMNLATTSIQTVKVNGRNVFKSTIIFNK